MKKLALMIFVVGIIANITYGNEQKNPTMESHSNEAKQKPYILFDISTNGHWTSPETYARQQLAEEQSIPKGYVINLIMQHNYNQANPNTPNKKRFVEKKIVSGRHEKYEQFIEGYEPKETFINKIRHKTPFDPSKESLESRWAFMDEPEQKNIINQNRLWLEKIERKQANMPSLSKKHQ